MADAEKGEQPVVKDEKPSQLDGETAATTRENSNREEKQDGEASADPFLVTFAPGDPDNPKNWAKKWKWGATFALSATGFNRIMVSTIMAPAINTLQVDLAMSAVEAYMALSVYLIATAFGPLFIGPLSEMYGRKGMIHLTNVWFLVWNLICGFAPNKGLLIAARLLAGFGASAVHSLGFGVLGDVWAPEQRGRSLGLYLLIPLLGAAIGPVIGGFITQYTTWRWMFWATSLLQAVLAVASVPVVYESYGPVLLRRRAARLRRDQADERYYAEVERREAGRSAAWVLRNSLSRPLRLLLFNPVVQLQAVLGGLNYGLLYFALASYSNLFIDGYGQSVSVSGLHYLAISIGEIIGAQLVGSLMDWSYRTLKARRGGGGEAATPELRVPLMVPGAILTPVGFFLYGWAAQYRVFWLVVDIGGAVVSIGLQLFGATFQAYVMDAFPEHVGSASAATQFLRSLTAFAFPLFAPQLYAHLGYGWGNSLLAFLSLGLAVPACAILWQFGARLRAKQPSTY